MIFAIIIKIGFEKFTLLLLHVPKKHLNNVFNDTHYYYNTRKISTRNSRRIHDDFSLVRFKD